MNTPARPLLDWRRAILFTHRWLGIAGGALFLLWFASGIVMLYVRMPSLDPGERLRRLPPLDLTAARMAPAEAARAFGVAPERLRVGMLGERPVYRFASGPSWVTVFADDGARLADLSVAEAMRLARGLHPEHAASARHDGRVVEPDQWTLQSRAFLPAHRIALGDADDTRVYLSERTGEAVMSTTRSARRWAYAGAVPHWLYFTSFRRHGPLWNRTIIVLSLAGCVLAATGLIGGVWQLAARRWRRSPYAGWMRWHHYAGVAFGLFTFTWVLSGMLSMDPVDWQPGTAPSTEQQNAVASGKLRLDALTLDGLRAAESTLATAFPVKELELVQLRSEPYLLAHRAPTEPQASEGPGYEPAAFLSPVLPFESRLVSAIQPEGGAFSRFDDDAMVAAARAAMPDARLIDATWLDQHDAYYYDTYGAVPLPVLRARFDDPGGTALYLDPKRGLIVHKEEGRSRWNRWLYHGLHSLDFRFLRERRALRKAIAILLCLGGIAVASTSMADGWRRLGRHLRRASGARSR